MTFPARPAIRSISIVIAALSLAGLYLLVVATGGQPNTLVHLAYLPIIVVAAAAGWQWGAAMGLAAGLLFGPATVTSGAASAAILGEVSWLIRLGAYVAVGTVSGIMWKRSSGLLSEVRAAEERLRAVVERAPIMLWALDRSGRFSLAEGRALDALGLTSSAVVGRTVDELFSDEPTIVGLAHDALAGSAVGVTVQAGGRIFDASYSPLVDSGGRPAGAIGVALDVTERVQAESELARLAAVVEQAADAIMITDPDGTVRYVNPAWESLTGVSRTAIVGQSPRTLAGTTDDPATYRAMWGSISRGRAWSGRLRHRKPDGSQVVSETRAAALHAADGAISSFVSISRDITGEQALAERLDRAVQQRATVAARLAALRPAATIEGTAEAICAEAAGVPGMDVIAILLVDVGRGLVAAATQSPPGGPLTPGRPLPPSRASYLLERADVGPWVEAFRVRDEDGDYGRAMRAMGLRAAAYAPILGPSRLVGVICLGTTSPQVADSIAEQFPTVLEFAAIAGALLGPAHERQHDEAEVRSSIEETIRAGAFEPVFQPIVSLASGDVVGYEALTRFRDGTPPTERFARAEALGLGIPLQLACLRKAIRACHRLPAGVWTSVNVSPGLLVDERGLDHLLADAGRPVVLEVTEHDAVEEYGSLRAAIETLGPGISLAVDDAGAGYASLRHILELRPRLVKLDVALIRGIDRDPARQAMVAGVHHFATETGIDVIAEGIETDAELAALVALGIELGQGFLLGRPASVRSAAASRSAAIRRSSAAAGVRHPYLPVPLPAQAG